MTFLAIDGFDHYSPADFSHVWTGGSSFGFPTGRISGSAIDIIFANDVYKSITGTTAGFAFQNNSQPGWFATGGPIFYQLTSLQTCNPLIQHPCPGTPEWVDFKVGIGLDAANRPYVFTTTWADDGACPGHPTYCDKWIAGATTFYGWGETPALNYSEWNYLEIDFSTLELRLNGNTIVTNASTQTIHGTLYSASGIADSRIYLSAPTLHSEIYFDDLYITSGSTFLGDIHIETVYPDADGTYTQWTLGPGGSGSTHFSRVDEVHMDGNLSYNYSDTAGQRDSYLMQPLTFSSGTIYATQLNLAASLGSGNEAASITAFIRQGGTNYSGAGENFSAFDATGSGYWYASFLSDTDPLSNPWTISNVNNDEYGILLNSVTPL